MCTSCPPVPAQSASAPPVPVLGSQQVLPALPLQQQLDRSTAHDKAVNLVYVAAPGVRGNLDLVVPLC